MTVRGRPRTRNQDALERTIAALRASGRIEPVDQATVGLARHVAHTLDNLEAVKAPAPTASLARVQLSILRTLRGLDDDDRTAGTLDDLLAALSSPMGDAPEH